jgi:Ca-activated chloride channel family protein
MISFEYPLALLLPLFYMICQIKCKPKLDSIFFSGTNFLKKASKKDSMLFKIAQILAITLLSIALASPIKKDEMIINNNKGYEISLILDVSGSMSENGKFDIVRDIVNDFLKKRTYDKVALSIFADFAYVAVPLTYDKKAVSKLLNRLEVGIAGRSRTALYEALFLSTNIFKNSKAKNKIAILLTDGMDNANTIPLDIAIKRARKYDVKVYTIGIGGRGDYNPYVLKEIAQKTGGEFFEADSVAKLKEVYETINRLEKSEIKTDKYLNKSYYFGYPLSFAILLLLVIFYIRNRR